MKRQLPLSGYKELDWGDRNENEQELTSENI